MLFCSYAGYILYVLKGKLMWRNYAIILCFYVFILIRNITNSVLYWHETNQGEMMVKEINNISTAQFLQQFIYNFCFFVLVMFFYNVILKMINFWDQLYFDMVQHYIATEGSQERPAELGKELDQATIQIRKNRRIYSIIMGSFTLMSVLLLLVQTDEFIFPAFRNRVVIACLSSILLLIDLLMIYKFYFAITRFLTLLSDGEEQSKRTLFVVYLFCFVYLVRAIGQNFVFRAGSEILYYERGTYYNIEARCRGEGHTWLVYVIFFFHWIQDVFPTVMGTCILLTY